MIDKALPEAPRVTAEGLQAIRSGQAPSDVGR